jgi:hypothetical protein
VASEARLHEDAEARVRGAQGYLLGRPGAAIDEAAARAALAALRTPAARAPAASG